MVKMLNSESVGEDQQQRLNLTRGLLNRCGNFHQGFACPGMCVTAQSDPPGTRRVASVLCWTVSRHISSSREQLVLCASLVKMLPLTLGEGDLEEIWWQGNSL